MDLINECRHSWSAKDSETITYSDAQTGELYIKVARGPHYCIKEAGHTADPTNDDHQCCCSATTE